MTLFILCFVSFFPNISTSSHGVDKASVQGVKRLGREGLRRRVFERYFSGLVTKPITSYSEGRESAGQSLCLDSFGMRRKVRAPVGRVPGNAWEAKAYGKCHRKYTAGGLAVGKGEMVR